MNKRIKNILSLSPYGIYEIYRGKKKKTKRCEDQKAIIDDYIKNNEEKKLHIGCGSNILKGWLNTDLKDTYTIAFLDAGIVFPIQSETFNFVYSEHLFEHLKVEQQLNILKESYRILKKGGTMRIAMPSLDFIFDLYSNPSKLENQQYVNWMVNNISNLRTVNNSIASNEEHYCYVINNLFKDWGHQMIHNYSSFKKLAFQCGYINVKQCNVGESDISALRNIEMHGTKVPLNINLIETIVIEMTK